MRAFPVRPLVVTGVITLAIVAAGCSSDPGDDTADSTGSASTSASSSASSSATEGSTSPSAATSSSAAVAVSPLPADVSSYVALGDSYTAAPGVPTTETDDGCLRSDGNYPSLLAKSSPDVELTDVSCSGATTTSLIGVQQAGSSQLPAQFDALQDDTSLVTLGIGGNDGNLFSTAVVTCLSVADSDPTGAPCRDSVRAQGNGDPLLKQARSLRGLVAAALRGIVDRSPSATVLLVGYPQPVPDSGTCAALPLASGDYTYVRTLFATLNTALRKAAARAGATFVDVATASKGHDICASDPWVNGAENAPGRAIAFHPFAEEQAAVADLVAQAAS